MQEALSPNLLQPPSNQIWGISTLLVARFRYCSLFPKWAECSRIGIYLCHSTRHASSMPLVLIMKMALCCPNFTASMMMLLKWSTMMLNSKASGSKKPSCNPMQKPTQWTGHLLILHSSKITPIFPPTGTNWFWFTCINCGMLCSRGMLCCMHTIPTLCTNMPKLWLMRESAPACRQLGHDYWPVNPNSAQAPQETQMQQSMTTHSGQTIQPPQQLIEDCFTAVSTAPLLAFALMFLSTTIQDEHESNLLHELHPLATLLSFLAAKSDPDTMMLDQALWELDAQEFVKAMEKEVAHHVKHVHWEVVPISLVPRGNKPILSVWSMKCKRDPGGEIIKWKARLCTHGRMQTKGVNYWETYLPVVSWTTFCLVLILSLIMG